MIIPGTFWFGRFDVMKKMDQIEEANVGIAIATASIDDEEMVHSLPQKSARIKRAGYKSILLLCLKRGYDLGALQKMNFEDTSDRYILFHFNLLNDSRAPIKWFGLIRWDHFAGSLSAMDMHKTIIY